MKSIYTLILGVVFVVGTMTGCKGDTSTKNAKCGSAKCGSEKCGAGKKDSHSVKACHENAI